MPRPNDRWNTFGLRLIEEVIGGPTDLEIVLAAQHAISAMTCVLRTMVDDVGAADLAHQSIASAWSTMRAYEAVLLELKEKKREEIKEKESAGSP